MLKLRSAPARRPEQGQTIIETVVGIFIMTMGITAALGLATFSLHASTNIIKQLVGMGLAREGIESVKNMRDSNWLWDSLTTGCYDYPTATLNAAPCYSHWLSTLGPGGYNINPGGGGSQPYRIYFDAAAQNNPTKSNYYWNIQPANPTKYGMDYDATGGDNGLYFTPNGGADPGQPDGFGTYYYRKITLSLVNSNPYGVDSSLNLLKVESDVWWTDKRCPKSSTFPGVGPCGVQLTMYLTNWKNYQ